MSTKSYRRNYIRDNPTMKFITQEITIDNFNSMTLYFILQHFIYVYISIGTIYRYVYMYCVWREERVCMNVWVRDREERKKKEEEKRCEYPILSVF